MVKVEDDALEPGEIVVGLKAQLRPLGAVQESGIGLLNPPAALALIIRQMCQERHANQKRLSK
jgi:hypothetical protein